ncbi:MAG TPA: hypothetical protein VD999_02955 [Vitreimonas sp.]|nr:hypothetical protein [Vitreimonas sp.]
MMWSNFPLSGIIFVIAIFFVLPFLVTVVLPAWLVPMIMRWVLNRQPRYDLPSLKPFMLSLMGLAIAANFFWDYVIFNNIYYEWDRIFLPYTFLWHETPSLGMGPNWLADGWELKHLFAAWLLITVAIYVTSALIAAYRARHHHHRVRYHKILIGSVLLLSLASLTLPPVVMRGIALLWNGPANLNYEEVNVSCRPSEAPQPRVLFTNGQEEWVTELDGSHQRPAFDKHLQLRSISDYLSPDDSMAAILWGQDLWIYCLNTEGALKISLPVFDKLYGPGAPRSFPSWSPDGTEMAMNNKGDLLLINLASKTTQVLKAQIAWRDNHVDLRSKNRDKMLAPYEYGDAYWSRDNFIYYTRFEGDTVKLNKLNPTTNEEQTVYEAAHPIYINGGSPTGEWLALSEYDWSAQRSTTSPLNKKVLLNTKTLALLTEFPTGPQPDFGVPLGEIIWSPSGKYMAQNHGNMLQTSGFEGPSVPVVSFEEEHYYSVTYKVDTALGKKGIVLDGETLAVELKDFVDDTHVLVKIIITEGSLMNRAGQPRQINAILDIKAEEMQILHDYPYRSFDEPSVARLEPLAVIR